ncbi:uncharacterized protein BJ212DRAFT_1303714 [Suillus subaureus]|uniref:Uncharacterized protein n=1 Tax=Suillus subaureus TaxID=48587 RepID=A0A9P7J722_9AGAM|nr:uncharacterized protein BJ212DRAFT_1303714 [Suillus subaureus]KAG1806198.1 hypothetical protein BJ212DRAFT_1303714 [Suillus subaureus]
MLVVKKKLALDHLIVQKMDNNYDNTGKGLQLIIMFEAKAMFEEGDESSKNISCAYIIAIIGYIDNDVEKLIEKTEVKGDQQAVTKEAGLSFVFSKVWAADKK